jgi:hypothetical protein
MSGDQACASCGRPRPAGSAFCIHCGAAAPTPQVSLAKGVTSPGGVSLSKPDPHTPPPYVAPPPPVVFPSAPPTMAAPTGSAAGPAAYPLAPPPGAPPPSPAPPAPGNRSRFPGKAVALVALVLVIIGGAFLGGWLLSDRDGPEDEAAAEPPARSDVAPTGQDPASLPPTTPTTPTIPVGVVCWDGSSAAAARDCAPPAGIDGLAWVYPSFDRAQCVPAGLPPPRLTVWQCSQQTADGVSVLIRYNEWQSVDAAQASYTAKDRSSTRTLIRAPGGKVVQTVWRYDGVNREGRVTLSALYSDWPFSVSVEGPSLEAINDGLEHLVVQRDPGRILTR